ncbi:variable surface protein Vir18, putative [Plasmodium vivax]|uniref:Variable surface protein Vir18, putative n=1 Tax=Plasmodium vivax (strain Salvador I) TaxID=126793 RepID=A5KD91_PLAVS|nr:variable surface protein Vir18, putative [Plasmodium vivax]EDL42678.1 variable surface protein Vir18, putative [Plasmodium vivax]|eukprot:XP_001612471.1 variable surface protein Vir18 [Plasmodium vivax Sal-1]
MSFRNRWSYNYWQQYEGASCYNNYSTYKREIEEKIDNLYRITNGNFYTQWHQLNEYIKKKNNEIKNCDRNKSTLDLLKDDNIKRFSTLCSNRLSCRTKPSSLVNNHDSLQPGKNATCKGDSCPQKKTRTKSPVAKLQSLPHTGSSNAKSSLNPKTINPVQEHHERKGSEQPSISSQAHQEQKHRGSSVQTEGGSPESLKVHNTAKPELEQSSAQSASIPAPVTTTEVITHQISHSPGSKASEESDASSPVQEIDLKGSNHQSGTSAGQTSDDNLPNLQSINGITDANQDPNNQIFRVEIEYVSDENPPGTSTGDVSSSSTDTACADTDKTNIHHATTCNKTYSGIPTNPETSGDEATPDELVRGEGAVVADVRSETNGTEDAENGPSVREKTDVIVFSDNGVDHKSFCLEDAENPTHENGIPCIAEKGTEIDANNGNILGTLREFFYEIQNNPHIIKTSIPIGIIFLLTLLFKYTPLWRILTKKKKKEPVDMNEELHSVLQEPLIMDDERSIPFSYGAFEYSTFDENTY